MNAKISFRKFITFCLLTVAIPGCKRQKLIKRNLDVSHVQLPRHTHVHDTPKAEPMLTVWIHGTRLFKLLAHPIDEYIHAAPPTGLHPVTSLTKKHRLLSVAKALAQVDPERFPLDHFYVFGWSGNLSFKERELAAKKLYAELKILLAHYTETHGFTPKIRLITHSHGGNVALNLAKCKNPADGITIAQAVLLASPVQKETVDYIHDPFFEKVYALYSTLDNLQVLDPQGMYKTEHNTKRHLAFSQRRFPSYPHLRQAKIKINGHGIPHIGFLTRGFINYLPTVLDTLDTWESENPSQQNQERLLLLHT
jgi:hypothetical protein